MQVLNMEMEELKANTYAKDEMGKV